MARFAAGGLVTAGSTTLPVSSLYTTAGMRARIREIGVFNQTATAVQLRLVRLSTTGTRGSAMTAGALYAEDPTAAICTATGPHTVAPTIASDLGYRVQLGAAIGSGFVWTFDDFALTLGAVANTGIGIVPEGTGQALSCYWSWTE